MDGAGKTAIEDSVIVITGSRITSVGTRAGTPVPKGGTIVDGSGKVVFPDTESGTLAVSQLADLVLRNAEPIESIGNTRRNERVMQAGAWLERQAP